jgi:alpha-L-fucosidase
LHGLRRWLDGTFAHDLARGARAVADQVRVGAAAFAADRAVDGDASTYWATDDGVTRASLELRLPASALFDQVRLREAVALGQRVESWAFDAELALFRSAPLPRWAKAGRRPRRRAIDTLGRRA